MRWSNILSVSTACLAVYAQTNLPPLADDTQWSVSTRITIDAPINEVWDVLLDWEKYSGMAWGASDRWRVRSGQG